MESTSSSLDDCLNLLRGERDEQKLVGLLLVTKLWAADDHEALLKAYKAVGTHFLHRLLITGAGGVKGGVDEDAYLKLSVTVMAGFCRIPEIASSKEMISEVPIVAEILSKLSDPSIYEECYEFLVLVASASENAITQIIESGSIQPLARHISFLHDGSRSLEHAVRLLQLILVKLPSETTHKRYLTGMSWMVVSLSRQFSVLHTVLKFDVMHMLTTLLSSQNSLFHEALRELSREKWAAYIQVGVMEILQNRIVSSEKLQALQLLDSAIYIVGQSWLLEEKQMFDVQATLPTDKFLFLVLESSRVEVAVLLNELAYLKYEASKSLSTAASILSKQHDLAVLYSLIEKIIELISATSEVEGTIISEGVVMQMISGLTETINLVLDYLQDAKDHCDRKGVDLLAAVKIVGSYLAEAPFACKEKTRDLLQYILSIEGEDESSPFYSICFLLRMLCQTTMHIDGCQALVSVGGHKSVVECLVKLLGNDGASVNNGGAINLACDIILNLLLSRKELGSQIEGSQFLPLMQKLCLWAENNSDPSIVMLASSICALVFDLTSEKNLLNHTEFNHSTLEGLSQLFIRSLGQGLSKDEWSSCHDLSEIVRAGYDRWSQRYPFIQNAVNRVVHLNLIKGGEEPAESPIRAKGGLPINRETPRKDQDSGKTLGHSSIGQQLTDPQQQHSSIGLRQEGCGRRQEEAAARRLRQEEAAAGRLRQEGAAARSCGCGKRQLPTGIISGRRRPRQEASVPTLASTAVA